MKNKRVSIKTIIIIVLVVIVIALISIIFNMKNNNIIKQEIDKEQLGEKTSNNSYVSMETHLSELSEKQKELDDMQNTAVQATVTEDKLLKDFTAYKDGKLITGTMANNGQLSETLSAGESYTIPVGYTEGGTITATDLASQTQGNATADNISKGKTAWVNGEKITGNLKNDTVSLYQLSTNAVSSISIDVSKIYPEYEELTVDNFLCDLSSYNVNVSGGSMTCSGVYNNPATSASKNNTISKNYNSTTGVFTASIANVSGSGQSSSEGLAASGQGFYYWQGRYSYSGSCTFIPYLIIK